ncbi:MAG: hypothetical protein PPP58_08355 [Natronomonas sp.]
MKQHALQTAMTLYQAGTLDVETAAKQAGVDTTRLERAVNRRGGISATEADARERIVLSAD